MLALQYLCVPCGIPCRDFHNKYVLWWMVDMVSSLEFTLNGHSHQQLALTGCFSIFLLYATLQAYVIILYQPALIRPFYHCKID